MNIKEIESQVNVALKEPKYLNALHEKILYLHENSTSSEEQVFLLEMHNKILDCIEAHLPKNFDIEKFRGARMKEYNTMLLRECIIGGSVCVETLYDITQRELEAGRMLPSHEFINASIQATASHHYSRDQLLRQKDKIEQLEENSTFSKFSKLFKD